MDPGLRDKVAIVTGGSRVASGRVPSPRMA